MKYSIAALTLLAAPFAIAGTFVERGALTELPSCAESATQAGISATGCAISDFACICGDSKFVTSLHSLIEKVCSAADQQITLAFAQQVCGAVGVSLNIPSPGATTSSSVAPASTTAAVPSASSGGGDSGALSASPSASTLPSTTPTPPYAFTNGTSSLNGTNSTLPFTGGASSIFTANKGTGFQLGISALGIAVVMGLVL